MVNTLHELGKKYATDKATPSVSNGFSYLHVYEHLFASLDKYESINILEIGVRGGNSVNMWLARFPNAHVVGVDICDCDFDVVDSKRFTFYKTDQTDQAKLKDIIRVHKNFDLIVDDGSHLIDDYVTTFYALYPALRKNGFYVIEDLCNNYEEWNCTKSTAPNGTGNRYNEFINFLVKNMHLGTAYDYSKMDSLVYSVQSYPGLTIITKALVE